MVIGKKALTYNGEPKSLLGIVECLQQQLDSHDEIIRDIVDHCKEVEKTKSDQDELLEKMQQEINFLRENG